MPIVSQFTSQDLPDYYAHQIRDFIRIHWFDAFQYDVNAPALPLEWHPVFFIVGEGQALFSHAAIATREVECNGQTYSCGGLSSVLTYPTFRKKGYGGQVVGAASDYLNASNFDLAILWTDAENEGFYKRAGWEHRPSIRTYSGDKNAPELYDAFTMIRLLSDRAKAGLADLESHPVYIGEYGW